MLKYPPRDKKPQRFICTKCDSVFTGKAAFDNHKQVFGHHYEIPCPDGRAHGMDEYRCFTCGMVWDKREGRPPCPNHKEEPNNVLAYL